MLWAAPLIELMEQISGSGVRTYGLQNMDVLFPLQHTFPFQKIETQQQLEN